jgi:hypothetical protein
MRPDSIDRDASGSANPRKSTEATPVGKYMIWTSPRNAGRHLVNNNITNISQRSGIFEYWRPVWATALLRRGEPLSFQSGGGRRSSARVTSRTAPKMNQM